MEMTRKTVWLIGVAAIAAGLAAVAGATIHASHNDFGLGRNMEITVNMMRELSLGYVDPIDPDLSLIHI